MGTKTHTKRKLTAESGQKNGSATCPISIENQDVDISNEDMHPLIKAVMQPLVVQGIPLSVSKICKAAGIDGFRNLKRVPKRKACYRWMLGSCKKQCPSGHQHLSAGEIPTSFAQDFCNQISPGIARLAGAGMEANVEEPPTKKVKAEV